MAKRLEGFDIYYKRFSTVLTGEECHPYTFADDKGITKVETSAAEIGTKNGDPSRRDKRTITMTVYDDTTGKRTDLDAPRHEIIFDAVGMPLAIGGRDILSPDAAVALASERLEVMKVVYDVMDVARARRYQASAQ